MADAPRLLTERLILRGHRASDLDHSFVLMNDPVVIRYIANTPPSREKCWKDIQTHIGQWHLCGLGFWVLENRSDGSYVGEAGFLDNRRDIVPSMDNTPETGWALHQAYRSQGLAQEALQAILRWGSANLKAETFACIIAPDNLPSLRLAARLGFVEHARTTYRGEPTLMLHRSARSE